MSGHGHKATIDSLVEAIQYNQGECVFLIGAGCSFSSGIPLASGLISEVQSKFPATFALAQNPSNYNDVMSCLTPHQRSELLNAHMEKAKINWAHLALAQLLKMGKVDRILTTNFDPLIVKATALIGFFPAIYDLAVSKEFKAQRIMPNSVFYLNGQHTGFVTLNTKEELNEHKARLREIVKNTGVRRIWVVIGYSGDADPLLDVLAEEIPDFDAGLYWIGYDEQPSENLKEKLLKPKKYVSYIGKQDADQFMTKLAQKLDCFPPELLSDPFQHVNRLIEHIDFATGGHAGTALKAQIDQRLAYAQSHPYPHASQASNSESAIQLLLAGKNNEVLEWYQGLTNLSEEDEAMVAWAYVSIGIDLCEQALALAPHDADAAHKKWQEAGEKYAQALQFKPDMHEALYNWGNALAAQALALAPHDADAAHKKWQEAGEKYAQALQIKPDKHEALNNWGLALAAQALALAPHDVSAAHEKWQEAGEKYAQALQFKPDMHDALYNWGSALAEQALALAPHDADAAHKKWQEAGEKYAQALQIKPDMHEALNNWGNALAAQALALAPHDADAAHKKWQEAGEKYAQALQIKPDKHDALYNWGLALAAQALALAPHDADAVHKKWQEAGEKYAQALQIKPDKHDALNNWGGALAAQARVLAPHDADAAHKKWQEAGEKYAQALQIKPDKHDALYNWGNALAAQALALAPHDADAAHKKWQEAGEKYAQALQFKPDMHEALYNWGSALAAQARVLAPHDADAAHKKWQEAGEKYAQALQIKPDMHDALNNWAAYILRRYHFCNNASEQASLLEQAEQLMQRLAQINQNKAAYNFACVYALKKELAKCIDYLEQSRLAGTLPSQKHINEEEDFQWIRHTAEFQSWYKSVFEK